MSVNIFRSKANQEKNYVTTRVSKESVKKSDYDFIGEMPWDFESEDAGRNDDPSRLGEYTEKELIEKIENFSGYAKSKAILENLRGNPSSSTK